MEVSSLQIGFDALVALLVSITGALGVWYSLKGKVTIQQMTLDTLSKDLEEMKVDKKDNLTPTNVNSSILSANNIDEGPTRGMTSI